jgi:hypothetical protein
LHEIFDTRFFSSINPTYGPDTRAKAVLHTVPYGLVFAEKIDNNHIGRVIGLAETDFDDFRSDYLGESGAICETALARESGP